MHSTKNAILLVWNRKNEFKTAIGILQNRFRFVDNFLILYWKNSIWDAMHDRFSDFR